MKRVLLLVATNVAVMLVLSIVVSVLGLDRWLAAEGIDYVSLLWFSAIFGFGGAFISLLMSKTIAKWSTGAHVIDGSEGSTQYWLVETVRKLAQKSGIGMPEVALYEGPANAFATGAFRNSALVAVSTGLLESMEKQEVEAVLGHEVAHVANGDMVDKAVFKTERGVGPGFYITMIVSQIVFGILASMIVAWFSRYREFRADRGSADLLGTPRPMIAALGRLGQIQSGGLPDSVKAFGINSESGIGRLFATHPPLQERIAALQTA